MFETTKEAGYEEILKSYQNDATVTISDSFTGTVRNGGGATFADGDHIDWPDKFDVLHMSFEGSTTPTEAVLVKVTSKDGSVKYVPFFAQQLGKRAYALDIDAEGKVLNAARPNIKYAGGDAADYFKKQARRSLQEVFNEMREKFPKGIDVSNPQSYSVYRYRTTDIITTYLYDYNFTK